MDILCIMYYIYYIQVQTHNFLKRKSSALMEKDYILQFHTYTHTYICIYI